MHHDEFILEPSAFGARVVGKLGTMRKARKWSVMPTDQEGRIIVQADGAIGQFDYRTGKGVLNTRGEYFVHLSRIAGAREFDFPTEFVAACLRACPALDSETDTGRGVVIVNTVRTI